MATMYVGSEPRQTDEGGDMQVGISATDASKVCVLFPVLTRWVELTPSQARHLATLLRKHAKAIAEATP